MYSPCVQGSHIFRCSLFISYCSFFMCTLPFYLFNSVKTEILEKGANSSLFIAKINKLDSGNYTCSINASHSYTVSVHVLNGKRNLWLNLLYVAIEYCIQNNFNFVIYIQPKCHHSLLTSIKFFCFTLELRNHSSSPKFALFSINTVVILFVWPRWPDQFFEQ